MANKLANAFATFFNFLVSAFDFSDLYDEDLDDKEFSRRVNHDAAIYNMWMY